MVRLPAGSLDFEGLFQKNKFDSGELQNSHYKTQFVNIHNLLTAKYFNIDSE